MAKYKALDIAAWFINRNMIDVNTEEDEKMTLLKLLKLLYYAEGCSLAINNESLFNEKILAWEHGPVVQEVWKYFKNAYNLKMKKSLIMASLKKITERDANLLEEVYSVFGKYSAIGLRDKTQSEHPWIEATNNGMIFSGEISRKDITDYFKETYLID